jgi:outer membrane scaffolding protein for murein synthesis (MipA/OmpV family)
MIRIGVKIMMSSRVFASAVAAGLLMTIGSGDASAQSFEASSVPDYAEGSTSLDGAPDKWRFTLGLGAGIAPDYEGSKNYQGVPLPFFRAAKGSRYGQLFGTHLTSNLINSPNWRIGPSVNHRKGYSDASNNRVDKLHNRGGSTEVGFKGGYVFQVAQVPFPNTHLAFLTEALYDVSDGHDGWLVTPEVAYGGPFGERWKFNLSGKVTYASGSYMSHYFSINSADSARSGLKDYNADAGLKDASVGFALGYDITKHWGIAGVAQFKQMLGDAQDSPVVSDAGESAQAFGGVMVTYAW